jgi:hypothetical protein
MNLKEELEIIMQSGQIQPAHVTVNNDGTSIINFYNITYNKLTR